jgi:methionyl-tRNA synthetase
MKPKKLITSALPYVNNVPHLGNIIGCVLSADVYARFCRSQGYETLYICATDEYGTATENKAREECLTCQEICDKFHCLHRQVYDAFNIAFDYFGRTSHPDHIEVTQAIFLELEKQGMIEEKETEQTYCEHHEMFLADRYVVGKCPFCGFEEARGDQCDHCGKLLQPTEIIDPRCQICGNTPTRRLTRHLYINLPKLEPRLREFHLQSMAKGHWSANAVSVTNGWLASGLLPRPITRDLSWGIPVPRSGYENKVFYVWFDAPIGYISATKTALPDRWRDWWQNPEHTELYQFMAKDNIPFHTVVFPACLLGTGQSWTLLHHISSTEYLNYEKEKFSKSRQIGVFGTDIIDSDIPIDLWRFYLLFNRPEKADANFAWDTFLEDINSNFIDNIGNLVNRVLVFFDKHFRGERIEASLSPAQQSFWDQVVAEERAIVEQLEKVQLKEALKGILALGKRANKFFQDETPWATIKTDPAVTRASLVVLIRTVRELGILLAPYMPKTSERILKMVGDPEATYRSLGETSGLAAATVGTVEILFEKLRPKQIDAYKARFSGQPADKSQDASVAWQQLRIQVGRITDVTRHPSADRLYVEQIDCGEGRTRTIVSGLVKHYTPDQLLDRKVLVVTNLKPADLRGVASEGMLLAVESKKGLEVITADDATVGARVQREGESESVPPNDVTIEQLMEADLKVTDHQVQAGDRPLIVEGNPLKTRIIAAGKVR